MSVTVRPATPEDLPAVAAIYAWETEHGVATFDTAPRPMHMWEHKLADPFVVAVEDGEVVGFAYGSQFREKPAYHRSFETTVYVARSHLGQGIGALLYADLLPRLRSAGVHTALALVALPNDGSVRLHEKAGFVHAGTMREVGDKHGRLIDVGIWQLVL